MATYDDLLAYGNKLKIHHMYLQFLDIERYDSRNKLNPIFMWKAYALKTILFSLRRRVLLLVPDADTRKYGINSSKFRGSVLWNNLPAN